MMQDKEKDKERPDEGTLVGDDVLQGNEKPTEETLIGDEIAKAAKPPAEPEADRSVDKESDGNEKDSGQS